MGMRRSLAILVGLLGVPAGCATAAPEERRAYVLAHPHAWIEVTLVDRNIPDVPIARGESAERTERPDRCSVAVEVNGEPWFTGSVFPKGDRAPYSAESGFRFPVPVGRTAVEVHYSGCRVVGDDTSVHRATELTTDEGLVYEVVFDGDRLDALAPRPDPMVTLEEVYEAVTGRRSPAD